MKIVQWGGQSVVSGHKKDLLKELELYDKVVSIIETHEDITYQYPYVRSNIDTKLYTGYIDLVSNKKVLVSIPEKFKFLIKIYGIKLRS